MLVSVREGKGEAKGFVQYKFTEGPDIMVCPDLPKNYAEQDTVEWKGDTVVIWAGSLAAGMILRLGKRPVSD